MSSEAHTVKDSFMAVFESRTRDEVRDHVISFGRRLGFDTVSLTCVLDRPGGEPRFEGVDNTPEDYFETFESTEMARRNPVSQHLKRSSLPLIWTRETYEAVGAGSTWEHQAAFGYKTGIALALHLPHGRHLIMGVDRDQDLPNDTEEIRRITADLQLFAVHAQEAAERVLLPSSGQAAETPSLTNRELETLKWTMEGKTAWEVGMILGISQRTAVVHMQNAMKKLDCVNKYQAVVKAMRAGLIR